MKSIFKPFISSPETESVEVEVEPELDRDEAEANYQKALNERNAQLTKCLATQNKLADYFKRKKTDEEKKKPSDEETNDLEIKYFGLIKSVDVVNQELADQKADYKEKIDDLDEKKDSKLTSVTDEWERYFILFTEDLLIFETFQSFITKTRSGEKMRFCSFRCQNHFKRNGSNGGAREA